MKSGGRSNYIKTQPSLRIVAAAHWLLAMLLGSLISISVLANPVGMTVSRGSANSSQSGSRLNIQASSGAVLNWRRFNIQAGETTTFIQPSSASVVWNRILDPNLSQVWGNLNANGWVVLMNQNGFYFGPNSVINVHGLMVTTSPVAPESSGGGAFWQFNGTPPLASIINYGEIKAQTGGSIFLVSERVENHGSISAPGGSIGLYAGKEVLVSERPDGRGLSASVKLPKGSVDNSGKLIADAGTIALLAQVVNQNGFVQANSVREHNGVIEFRATDDLQLGADSAVQAKGAETGVSKGGNIIVKSDQIFTDTAGSRIEVSGGAAGGNGGNVEISASKMSSIHSRIVGGARKGWKGGNLVLDPTDIFLSSGGTDSAGSGTIQSGDSPDTLNLNVGGSDGSGSAFSGFSQIHLEATRDITLQAQTIWDLNLSTGLSDAGSRLTLEAGRDIQFGENARITGGGGWSVRLAAGVDFSTPQHSVRNGIGSIRFDVGNGALETSDGSISLEAGHDILLGNSGFVRTTGGGNIDIKTGNGDVDAGNQGDPDKPEHGQGYLQFTRISHNAPNGYALRPNGIGGIGTENGGNLTIDAGHDIKSDYATVGAYGPGGGNVTLMAANNISGQFIVLNGQGTMKAGADLGSSTAAITLSLVKGGWDLTAGNNLYINQALNPNGVFNFNPISRVRYRFDYAPDAYLHLTAGNSVQLLGNNLRHLDDNGGQPPVYPPQLSIQAGAGGVILGNNLTLYPSAAGQLQITTTAGGSLESTLGSYFQIVVSDSGSADYTTFVSGHAPVPLHLLDLNPISLAISGDLQNIFLRSAKRTDISVGGKALNFSFEGQNLRADDVSKINIGGAYLVGSDRVSVVLADAPTLDAFDHVFVDPLYVANANLAVRLTYDPVRHKLGVQGALTADDLDFLAHPKVKQIGLDGNPVLDADGLPILVATKFTRDVQKLTDLYDASQFVIPDGAALKGLQIGGPGALAISAGRTDSGISMDLGASKGIRSVGALLNPSLDSLPRQSGGAKGDLTLDLAGDLKMTSSQIATFNGGKISVTATHGGTLNVGSQEQFTSDDTPKGIYTAHGGDLSVTADGTIDVNGSRIGTFDGGNVTVNSLKGDVNAGVGARGHFIVATRLKLNPSSGNLEPVNQRYSGSGILAFTATDSHTRVGDVTVLAGNDILANSGGILQLVFNGTDLSSPLLSLNAGRDISANQAGVLGVREKLTAGRDIKGLFVAAGDIALNAQQNFSGSILGGGSVSVSAGQSVSGTIVGGGAVGVSGSEVSATIISTAGSASASGDVSKATLGAFASVAAPAAQQVTTETEKKTVANKSDEEEEDLKRKRAAAAPVLSKTTGRVTVILPNKQ